MKFSRGLLGLMAGLSLVASAKADQSLTNIVLTVTNNITVTWNWQAEYHVTVGCSSGNGSVLKTDDWVAAGANYTNAAAPNQYCVFDRWEGAPSGYETNNPIVVPVNAPLNLIALFRSEAGIAAWLSQYGLTIDQQNEDTDGDGFLNWQEYVADTNPTNQLSHMEPLLISKDGSSILLILPNTSTNRNYVVHGKSQLGDLEWSLLSTQPGNGSNVTWQVNNAEPQGYYRTSVELKNR